MSVRRKTGTTRMVGYCDRCRAKELERYGTIIGEPGRKHSDAVKRAGCCHPAHYRLTADRPGKR
jgi:hypothetical protein